MGKKEKPEAIKYLRSENEAPKYHSPEDDKVMTELWKKIITFDDVDTIYRLYKKYVDSTAPYPVIGCSACELSASRYYERLRDFHHENKGLFI